MAPPPVLTGTLFLGLTLDSPGNSACVCMHAVCVYMCYFSHDYSRIKAVWAHMDGCNSKTETQVNPFVITGMKQTLTPGFKFDKCDIKCWC